MVGIKILHLSLDDKFVDIGIQSFEKVAPESTSLFVYGQGELKFVKSPCSVVNKKDPIINKVNPNDYDLIVVHALVDVWYTFLLSVPDNIPIVWLGWGFDYYDLIPKQLLLKDTIKLVPKNRINIFFIKRLFHSLKRRVRTLLLPKKTKVMQRINYFSPVLESEYYIVKNNLKNLFNFPKYIPFNYGSLEANYIKGYEDKIVQNKDLLVGNSATYTNNHLEAFKLVRNYEKINPNGKIVCPLSYGENSYQQIIIETGREIFGDKFLPVVDYMPIQQYVGILINCGFVIMNHVRQQALGNILIMLYLGAKVLLREENPVYTFLKNHGAILFSIQTLEEDKSLLSEGLSVEDIHINRKVLMSIWSEQVVTDMTKSLIATALSSKS